MTAGGSAEGRAGPRCCGRTAKSSCREEGSTSVLSSSGRWGEAEQLVDTILASSVRLPPTTQHHSQHKRRGRGVGGHA